MTSTQLSPDVTAVRWSVDPVHSTIGFAVKHNVVATFRGSFREVTGSLGPDGLHGVARVEGVVVEDENLEGHLLSPEFFDAERHPELHFDSSDVRLEDGRAEVAGDLTIKGVTRPVVLRGSFTGPVTDAYGNERIGLEVETTIDRREFGLDWNAPLPGGGLLLANEVTITGDLQLTRDR